MIFIMDVNRLVLVKEKWCVVKDYEIPNKSYFLVCVLETAIHTEQRTGNFDLCGQHMQESQSENKKKNIY